MTPHQTRLIMDASNVAARTVGFLTAMLDHERLDPVHHAAARDLINSARAVMDTPMFPQSTPAPRQLEPVGEARSFKGGM